MNGIERIKSRIENDTQAEIDAILNNARNEAEHICLQFKSQAEAVKSELTSKNAAEAKALEERLITSARTDAKKVVLSAKQELLDKAYASALDKLCSMTDEEYIRVVAALLVKAAPNGVGEVIFSSDVRSRIGTQAIELANSKLDCGKLIVSSETRPLKGGFILKNGNVEVNCAFETIVRLQRTETAGSVAKILFPDK